MRIREAWVKILFSWKFLSITSPYFLISRSNLKASLVIFSFYAIWVNNFLTVCDKRRTFYVAGETPLSFDLFRKYQRINLLIVDSVTSYSLILSSATNFPNSQATSRFLTSEVLAIVSPLLPPKLLLSSWSTNSEKTLLP